MWRLMVICLFTVLAVSAAAAEKVKIINPSFEESEAPTPEGRPDWAGGPAGWRVWFGTKAREAGAKISWEGSGGRTGDRCVSLKGCAGGACVIQSVPVESGRGYMCSVWGKRTNPESACILRVRWAKADRSWQSGASVYERVPAGVGADKWVRLDVAFIAPEEAAYAVILLSADEQKSDDVCWFDDFEMAAFDPGALMVSSCRWMHENLRPVGKPVETPHITWGKPYAKGNLRVLFILGSARSLREPFELGQRLSMDLDYVMPHYEGKGWYAFNNIEIMRRLDDGYYDAVVVTARTQPETLAYLARRCKGLVLVCPVARLPESFKLSELGEEHFLSEPKDALPDVIVTDADGKESHKPALKHIRYGSADGTRIAWIAYEAGSRCLTPIFPFDYHVRTAARYWEAYLQVAARAIIWASAKEMPGQFVLKFAKGNVQLVARSADAFKGKLELTFADKLNVLRGVDAGELSLRPGEEVRRDIEIPHELPAGGVTCFAVLKDGQGHVAGFACARGEVQHPLSIRSIEPKKLSYNEGEKASVTVRIKDGEGELKVVGFLRDAFGRTHARSEAAVTDETATVSFDTGNRLSTFNWVEVQLLSGDKVLDAARWYVLVPLSRQEWLKEYQVGTWAAAAYMPQYVRPALHAMMSEIGITEGLQSRNGYLSMLSSGLWPISTSYGRIPGYRPHETTETIRKPCFSDPEVRQKMAELGREIALEELPYRPLFGYLKDETSLVKSSLDVDVCSCEFCQQRCREWLKQKYLTLEDLNRRWGTAFHSWDEIVFVTYKDVRGKDTFAPWLMYRRFMDWAWAEGVDWIKKHAKQADPGAMLALANTFGPNPFSGRDYYLLCKANDYWMEYAPEVRTPMPQGAMRVNFDTIRCFGPHLPNHPWVGYRFSDETTIFGVWWTALHGATGVSPYGVLSLAPPKGSWALVFPTLQHTRRGQVYAREIGQLRSGIGKLVMNCRRTQAPIAILWSQAGTYVAWAMSGQEGRPNSIVETSSHSQFYVSRQTFRHSVLASGRQFDCIREEQILEGGLKNYRCLVLPAAYAISEGLAGRLETFVQQGGILVADMGCGLTNEVGRLYKDGSPMAKLFGFERKDTQLSYDERAIPLPFGEEGKQVELSCIGGEDIEPAPGVKCIRDSKGRVACITRTVGKGRTFLMNCVAPDAPEMNALWEGLTQLADVTSLDGKKQPRDFELVMFENGEHRYVGVLHNYLNEEENYPVRIQFHRKGHFYDVRKGKYLGEKDVIETDIAPGDCALYALLPYRAAEMKVRCGEAVSGKPCKVDCELLTPDGKTVPGRHVLHVRVMKPDGAEAAHYNRNVIAGNGRGSFTIPFALNDEPGRWTVEVRDVASGASASGSCDLAR